MFELRAVGNNLSSQQVCLTVSRSGKCERLTFANMNQLLHPVLRQDNLTLRPFSYVMVIKE